MARKAHQLYRRGRNNRRPLRDELSKIYIFPDGETEFYYFNKFAQLGRSSGYTLRVVKSVVGNSAKLVEDSIAYLRNIDRRERGQDCAYVVFDMDINLDNRLQREQKVASDLVTINKYNRDADTTIRLTPIISNDAFELWYLLHFRDVNSLIMRNDLITELNKFLPAPYDKPAKDMYDFLTKHGDVREAIRRAKALCVSHQPAHIYGNNPVTQVADLVVDLFEKFGVDGY